MQILAWLHSPIAFKQMLCIKQGSSWLYTEDHFCDFFLKKRNV